MAIWNKNERKWNMFSSNQSFFLGFTVKFVFHHTSEVRLKEIVEPVHLSLSKFKYFVLVFQSDGKIFGCFMGNDIHTKKLMGRG